MNKLNGKNSGRLIFICSLAYFVSYLTRINFAAVITAIIADGDIDKYSAGAVTTLGFITYGIGQLVSGWLGDKINPKKLMFIGFILTGVMNLSIPFCPNGFAMCCVWAVNGFAQSLMWPPMVKIMHTSMESDKYNSGCIKVCWGSTAATIMIYLISPLIIKFFNWRTIFYISSLCAFIMSAVWMGCVTKIEKTGKIVYTVNNKEKIKHNYKIGGIFLAITMIAIALQGSLRDGVTTWVPTYISENFNLGSEISILSGVVLPVFGLVSFQITSFLYKKLGKKPFKCAGILFVFATACVTALAFFRENSVIFTLAMFGIIVASMHGINLILVCFVPAIYADYDNVSSLSGILNFMTYVGSAASTYGFAVVSDKAGWSATIILWAVIAFAGAVLCIICNTKFKKQR